MFTTFDANTCIWSGPEQQPKCNPDVSVASVVLDGLNRRPNHVAQIGDTDGSRINNAGLLQMSVRAALQMKRIEGIESGNVVGMVVRNHRIVAPLVVGCVALGAPLHALSVNSTIG